MPAVGKSMEAETLLVEVVAREKPTTGGFAKLLIVDGIELELIAEG